MTTPVILPSPDRWSFRGVDLTTLMVNLREITGAEDLPPLRGGNVVIAGAAGRRYMAKESESRRIAFALWIGPMADDGSLVEPTAHRQAQANLDALGALFAQPGQGALVHYMPDGTTRTAQAEVAAFDSIDRPAAETFLGVVDFELADPWFYGPDVVDTARAISASPTAWTFVHPGKVRGHRVLLDFIGPIANPRMTNTTLGIWVECLVTVASGKHLLIDGEAVTATNDGVNAIGSIRHSGALAWLLMTPGNNALSVTATTPGGTLTTTFRPPYR